MKKSIEELKREAQRLAAELQELPGEPAGGGGHQGSAHRALPEELRRRVVALRSDMFEWGIYDPLLVRFDTATVAQADTAAIAGRLASWGGA